MKLNVMVNGIAYDVDVEILEQGTGLAPAPLHVAPPVAPPRHAPAPAYTPPPSPSGGAHADALKSPIPGTIVEIKVAVGQAVKAGETVLVIDAMKMNTPVSAPITGKVIEILVSPGDPVKMGQALIRFE